MEREEAISKIKYEMHRIGKDAKEALETLVPELRESEDERMMREFNDWLCEEIECRTNDLRDEKDRRTLNMLCYVLTKVKDWLEKQKEQKPTPDWMPKFLDELRSKKNYFDWDRHRDIEGHILAIINWIDPNYFDRKEKEQKSAEKQDYSGLTDFERAIHRGFLCAGVENVPVTIIKETAQECMAKIKPAEWSEDAIRKGIQEVGLTQHQIDWLRENVFPPIKQEWSEEDEKMLEAFLHKLEVCDILTNKEVMWAKHRLKSLSPQPKQEWSEDDKQWLESTIREYEERLSVDKDHAAVIQVKIDLLKSLRPHWKPSEEQMEALETAKRWYSDNMGCNPILESLLEQLKKL